MRVFKALVESIPHSESWALRMLRMVQNISWTKHPSNKSLYGSHPRISTIITQSRLALAVHMMRHNERARRVLLCKPDATRRPGRPCTTLRMFLEDDTGLEGEELLTATMDRGSWMKNFILVIDKVGCDYPTKYRM